MAVILETSLGDLTVDLYTDERPRCKHFVLQQWIPYYRPSIFHSKYTLPGLSDTTTL